MRIERSAASRRNLPTLVDLDKAREAKRQRELELQKAHEAEELRLDRRSALWGLAGLTSVAAMGGFMYQNQKGRTVDSIMHKLFPPANEDDSSGELYTAQTLEMADDGDHVRFKVGAIEKKQVMALEGMWLGIRDHKYPEELALDFSDILSSLWQGKITHWERKLQKRHKDIDPNVLVVSNERTEQYKDRWFNWTNVRGPNNEMLQYGSRAEAVGRTTLSGAATEINQMMDAVKSGFDTAKLAEAYHLKGEQAEIVFRLVANIDGDGMLAAYALTELLPRWNGTFNSQFLDTLLQTAGKHYVANLPSLGDPSTSFGPLQFTANALADVTDPTGKQLILNGASIANKALADPLKLPESLDKLYEFVDHFKAGYLFAINNIAHAVHKMEEPVLSRMKGIAKADLLAFMSASHNNPNLAGQSLTMFLEQDPDSWGAKTFVNCTEAIDEVHLAKLQRTHSNAIPVKISDYAKKTILNYHGIRTYLGYTSS